MQDTAAVACNVSGMTTIHVILYVAITHGISGMASIQGVSGVAITQNVSRLENVFFISGQDHHTCNLCSGNDTFLSWHGSCLRLDLA